MCGGGPGQREGVARGLVPALCRAGGEGRFHAGIEEEIVGVVGVEDLEALVRAPPVVLAAGAGGRLGPLPSVRSVAYTYTTVACSGVDSDREDAGVQAGLLWLLLRVLELVKVGTVSHITAWLALW